MGDSGPFPLPGSSSRPSSAADSQARPWLPGKFTLPGSGKISGTPGIPPGLSRNDCRQPHYACVAATRWFLVAINLLCS
jgi:hypothetical protein